MAVRIVRTVKVGFEIDAPVVACQREQAMREAWPGQKMSRQEILR